MTAAREPRRRQVLLYDGRTPSTSKVSLTRSVNALECLDSQAITFRESGKGKSNAPFTEVADPIASPSAILSFVLPLPPPQIQPPRPTLNRIVYRLTHPPLAGAGGLVPLLGLGLSLLALCRGGERLRLYDLALGLLETDRE